MTIIAQIKAKHSNDWVRARRVREDLFVVECTSVQGWVEVPMLAANSRQKAVQEMRRLARCLLPDDTGATHPECGG